jgi:hypothetical protein
VPEAEGIRLARTGRVIRELERTFIAATRLCLSSRFSVDWQRIKHVWQSKQNAIRQLPGTNEGSSSPPLGVIIVNRQTESALFPAIRTEQNLGVVQAALVRGVVCDDGTFETVACGRGTHESSLRKMRRPPDTKITLTAVRSLIWLDVVKQAVALLSEKFHRFRFNALRGFSESEAGTLFPAVINAEMRESTRQACAR